MVMDFLVDWLEFTYLVPEGLNGLSVWENFLADFPEFDDLLKDMVLLKKGRNGYTQVYAFCDEFTLSYNPEEERLGVHVTFPAHGLYRIMSIFGLDDFSDYASAKSLFMILKERSCRISRLDIAFDDYTKTFTPRDFALWRLEERISTKCKVCGYLSSEATRGGTFTLGRRGGQRYLRIYDKEYESKGLIDAIRYEFELRHEFSDLIVNKIINDSDFCIVDLIEDMFYITNEYELSGDSNVDSVRKVRAGVDEKWSLFLQTVRELFAKPKKVEVKVCNKKQHNSFSKKKEWVTQQVLPTLFMFAEVMGLDRLNEMIESSQCRLKPLQWAMLDKFRYEYENDID